MYMYMVPGSITRYSSVHRYSGTVQEYTDLGLVEYMDALDRLRPLGTSWCIVVYSYMGRLGRYGIIVAR